MNIKIDSVFQFTRVCKFTDWLAVVHHSHDENVLIYHK